MYTLLALVAVATYLLLACPREKLEPTSTIVAPVEECSRSDRMARRCPYSESEVARIRDMQPDYLRSEPDYADGVVIAGRVAAFYTDVYKPSTTAITQAQIDDYIKQGAGGDYPYPTYGRPNSVALRKVLTEYFIGAAAANALPVPTNMGTMARWSDRTPDGRNPVKEAIDAAERSGGTGGTGATGGTTTTGTAAAGGVANNATPVALTMPQLEARYKERYDLYTQYASEALATESATTREELIVKIKNLNTEIAAILADMIRSLTESKNTAPSTDKLRDELVSRLQKIQFEYNGLLVSTDKLTTLRRIRQFETAKSTEKVNTYLIGLAVLSALLVIAVILKS